MAGISKEDLRWLTEPGDVPAFAIELQGELIGLAQVGEELDPDYRHANVDLFIGTAWHGRGLGADTVRTLGHWLFGAGATPGSRSIPRSPTSGPSAPTSASASSAWA